MNYNTNCIKNIQNLTNNNPQYFCNCFKDYSLSVLLILPNITLIDVFDKLNNLKPNLVMGPYSLFVKYL